MLHEKLLNLKQTLAIAESLTGGLIATLYTNTPGTSKTLAESIVCYSVASKIIRLGINPATIHTFGLTSCQVATEMAQNVRAPLNTNWGISATGIAGSDGGNENNPVGTVAFAVAYNNRLWTEKIHFKQKTREKIRHAAAEFILHKTEECFDRWVLNS